MNIIITPRIEAMIQERVDSGQYDSADTRLIEAALRLLEQEEKRAWLRAALAEGDEGEPIPYTPELLESIERSVRRRFESRDVPWRPVIFRYCPFQ